MNVALLSVGLGLFWALLIRFISIKFMGSDCQLFYFWWFATTVICGTILILFNV